MAVNSTGTAATTTATDIDPNHSSSSSNATKKDDDDMPPPQVLSFRFASPSSINVVQAVPAELLVGVDGDDERLTALKEWIYQHEKDAILNALIVQVAANDDVDVATKTSAVEDEGLHPTAQRGEVEGRPPPAPADEDDGTGCTSSSTITSDAASMPPTICSTQSPLLQKRLAMLDSIAKVQRQFFQAELPSTVFGSLLDALLVLMESEYGFIGEIKYDDMDDNGNGGAMYLQTHAITNIAWDETSRQFYNDNKDSGLRFYNLQSLFGNVMTTQQAVISNDPRRDARACGVPQGHPPLDHFLGIPFFQQKAADNRPGPPSPQHPHQQQHLVMNGMVGISNKPGGYSDADVAFLEPFTVTCSNLIQAYWQKSHNQYLIDTLEAKVGERTAALEKANENLAAANRRIVQASQRQLEQFASMSHEIRTPLNCIIGTGSLILQQLASSPSLGVLPNKVCDDHNNNELALSQQQRLQHNDDDNYLAGDLDESIKLIVTSGDLLLSVVNDVLDYSKLESGHLDITVAPCSLQDTLSTVLQSIQKIKAKSKQTTLRACYDAKLPDTIKTDSRRLQQILFNLLGNAVKFSKERGVIEFSVKLVDIGSDDDAHLLRQQHNNHIVQVASEISVAATAPMPTCTIKQDDDVDVGVPKGGPDEENEEEPQLVSRCPFRRSSSRAPSEEGHAVPTGGAADNDDDGTRHGVCVSRQQEPTKDGTCTATASMCCWKGTIIRFEVKDFGQGISPDDFESIFSPFHQTRTGKNENVYGGTGLGLAITKKLVNGMGGTISVDSVEGQWSKFTVDLPFLDVPVDTAALSAALQHVSVLLVRGGGSIASPELACATRVLGEYHVDARLFDTLAEVAAMMQGDSCLKSDRSYVCLVHEDQYDATTADALAASPGENVTLVTVGKQFTPGRTSHHVRSLEQMIPCTLVKTILAMSEGKRHKVESVASPPRSVAVHEGMDRLRILLAEDNLVNIKVMLHMLNRIGVKHIDVARNGEEAVAAESAKVYDVILMDMSMPIMDGLEAARLIGARRRDNERRSVDDDSPTPPPPLPRIVFVTAHVSADFEEQCRQAGGCGFLPKPFKVDEIETLMRRICNEMEESRTVDEEMERSRTEENTKAGPRKWEKAEQQDFSSASIRFPD